MRCRNGVKWLVVGSILMAISLSAHSVTYQYQGNQFNFAGSDITIPCDPGTGGCLIDSVTVSLDFTSALAANLAFGNVTPDSWSISDGLTLITDSTAGIASTAPFFQMQVSTDSLGDIAEWLIDINPVGAGSVAAGEWSGTRTRNFSGFIDDQTRYCQSGSCSFQGLATTIADPGIWTTTVPLPAGAWLLVSALALLGGMRRLNPLSR